jgi:hypothetical protein
MSDLGDWQRWVAHIVAQAAFAWQNKHVYKINGVLYLPKIPPDDGGAARMLSDKAYE